MNENSINIIRFSDGYWPDFMFTANFASNFIISFWLAIFGIILLNLWLEKKNEQFKFPLLIILLCITFFLGYDQMLKLDYSLEAVGYMVAAGSGVSIFVLLVYFLFTSKNKIWRLLPFALLCGFLSAIITLNLHQEVEKFTYFSEKLYNQISLNKINTANRVVNSKLALFSFGLYIGLAEEFCKLLFLVIPFWHILKKSNFSEIFILTILGSTGFSIYENIIYAYNYGVNISIVRNLFNGHIFFGMLMSLMLSKIVTTNILKMIVMIFGIYVTVSFLHGVWDFVAVNYSERKIISYGLLGGSYFILTVISFFKLYADNKDIKTNKLQTVL